MPVVLTQEEFEARNTKEGFEHIMTKVCRLATEDALRLTPSVVQSLVTQVASLRESKDQFYLDYPELATHKAEVARLFETLEAQHPGRPLSSLSAEVARVAKSRLAQYGTLAASVEGKPSLESLDHLAGMFEKG